MERRTPVYVVCSPRGRVGKTMVARLLTEFLIADKRRVVAFDLNPDEFTLADYLPRHTAIADLANTRGQMALFDQLIMNDEIAKVVDLGSFSFERFFRLMHELSFASEARHRAIEPVVFFLVDPDRRSIQAYANLHSRFPEMALVPVYNEGIGRVQFAEPSPASFPVRRAGAIPVRIPQLPPFLKAVIEKPGFTFTGFLRRPAETETGLHAWIKRAFIEFRELELRLLLEQLKSGLMLDVRRQTTEEG
jgi:hypothetical protein